MQIKNSKVGEANWIGVNIEMMGEMISGLKYEVQVDGVQKQNTTTQKIASLFLFWKSMGLSIRKPELKVRASGTPFITFSHL